jgi:hypothetical protein
VAAAAGAAAVVVAVAIALGSGGNDDGGQTSTSGAADLDTVLAAASPLFSSDECAEATADNAPLAFSHGITPAIKCASSSVPFTGTYWCTDSSDSLLAARAVFLATAADTRVDITETPAGSDTVADGVQQSYHRIGSGAARVYWDSPAALCGAELQSTSPDTAPLIEFWHSG